MNKASIAERVAERFSLPPEAVANIPKVTVSGKRQVLVENHKGLLGYGSESIDINGGKVILRIRGEDLELLAMNKNEMLILGNIISVEFE